MALRTDLLLLLSRILCFAAAVSAMILYCGNSTSGQIRMRAFSYLGLTLMIQGSIYFVVLFVHLMSMCVGSTAPVLPRRPVLLLALILAEWLLACVMMGAASSALGVFMYFLVNDFFDRSVNVRALLHCGLSLMSGGFSLLSAYLTVEIAHSRRRQPQD